MSDVTVQISDGVALVTLNRPDRLNALTPQMGREYAERMVEAAASPDVRVIVVTGAGRGFCSGADIAVLSSGAGALGEFVDEQSTGLSPTVALDLDVPVVMAVNGPAAGLGFVLALTGDVCFAGTDATFISAFPRLGLVAEYGIAWLLPRIVGHQRAAELLLSGRPVDAVEAYRIGLVHAVSADAVGDAMAWARVVAQSCAPWSLAQVKRQLNAAAQQDFAKSMTESLGLMRESFGRPDLPEALLARSQGRPPVFAPRQD